MESKGQQPDRKKPDKKKLKAFAREIRVAIVSVLRRRSATIRQLAAETGEESLAIVAYHVMVLRECGAVEPEDEGDGGECRYRAIL
jgi:DNA-binding transcriptional ArsR family regulator